MLRNTLSDIEKERYHRQMLIRDWGEEGQEKLKSTTIFVAGAGGLGSPATVFLAAAGIGTIRICDCGEPELSNLNRQILHTEADIAKPKVISAEESLLKINPNIAVEPLHVEITDSNIDELVGKSDIMLDCLDNFDTRHILNRLAVKKQLPLVHAGIHGLSGQLTFIHSPETPCLYCIFPGRVPREIFPVAGVTPGVIGTLEALEALKWILGIGENLKGKLLLWDGEVMEFQKIEVRKDPECLVCRV